MRLLLVVVALVVAAWASDDEVDPDDPQQLLNLLNSLKDDDEEGLLLNTSEEEDQEHLSNLKKSVKEVNEHNKNDGKEWQAGYNEFSFMDDDQKESHLGLNESDLIRAKRDFFDMERLSKRDVLDLAARQDNTVDYSGKLPAIKNQGSCGSCWTFGAAAALEYQLNRKYDNPKAISEEQLLDCTYPTRNGCNGGWPADCYTWIKNAGTGGKTANYVASMADYPYAGSDGACKITSKNQMSGFAISGTKYLQNEAAVYAAVGNSQIGVLSVAIAVVSDFYSFKSGVYDSTKCNVQINHAVDIVGYGVLSGVNYYKVRNSWGSSWGDGGYIRMKRGSNLCKITSYAHYPVVTGESDDEEEEEEKPTDGSDEKDCKWVQKDGKLKSPIGKPILSMTEAQAKCLATTACAGISCKNKKKCQMAKKSKCKPNEKFTAYILKCSK